MSLTPAKLRACVQTATRNHGWAPIMVQDCPMLADAIEIADSGARSDIECFTVDADFDPVKDQARWYDTRKVEPSEPLAKAAVERALRYLAARGLLLRKDGAPHIVSFKTPD